VTAIQPAASPDAWGVVSRLRRDDELVLATQVLKRGTDETTLSRFGDDRWNLAPAVFRENAPHALTAVNFATLYDPVQRLTAKEFIWARLNEPSPCPTRVRMAPTVARATLTDLSGFMAFVARHAGTFTMHTVDQAILDAYLAELRRERGRTAERVAHLLDVPIELDRYSPFLTLGGFCCRPWRGRSAARVAGLPPRAMVAENRTPRIPEPVIGALLRWSLKYVDLFAIDIFAARAELDRLEQAIHLRDSAEVPAALIDRLDVYIGRRCADGRGIPISAFDRGGRRKPQSQSSGMLEPAINFHLIALQLGCDKRFLISRPTLRRRLERAIERLGGEIGGMDSTIAVDPDTGLPWRERFDERSIAEEERMLQAAAYVICAYLTGMRDSELQAMRVGCWSLGRSADGIIERHRIKSITYKARETSGEEAEWVTIAPVARAIEVVERLTVQQREIRVADTIWQTLAMNNGNMTVLRGGVIHLINGLRDHLDARSPEGPAIPHVEGGPWWFTPRQFRRTLAWYIANRPFGTVAGKIQYKHASIAMFEGYSGSSPSGFRREVEQERALSQIDDVVEHYEEAIKRGLPPAGPAAARLRNEFARIRDELGDLPGRIVDAQRLRSMLGHLGRTLHVGLLADCFFDPDTALCLDRENATTDRSAPALSHCRPDRCPNACVTRRHLAPWQASIAEGEHLLQDRRLSSLQRQVLTEDNERKRRLIAPLLEGTPE
jgi:integrase